MYECDKQVGYMTSVHNPCTSNKLVAEPMQLCNYYVHVHGSSFFLGKVTALGVLCCFALFVCLTLLASFFLPSHLSFKNMYVPFTCIHDCT